MATTEFQRVWDKLREFDSRISGVLSTINDFTKKANEAIIEDKKNLVGKVKQFIDVEITKLAGKSQLRALANLRTLEALSAVVSAQNVLIIHMLSKTAFGDRERDALGILSDADGAKSVDLVGIFDHFIREIHKEFQEKVAATQKEMNKPGQQIAPTDDVKDFSVSDGEAQGGVSRPVVTASD